MDKLKLIIPTKEYEEQVMSYKEKFIKIMIAWMVEQV